MRVDSNIPQTVGAYSIGSDIKDDLINDFPNEAAAMVRDIKLYWETNVGKYFSKSSRYPNPNITHNLQKACVVNTLGKSGTGNGLLIVELAPIYSNGFEYGVVLMKGRSPADHSIYVPKLGKSIDIDRVSFSGSESFSMKMTTRGTTNEAWNAWTRDFNTYVKSRTLQFVRECIRKGLIRRKR